MMNANNTDNHSNAGKLLSSQRDFKKQTKHHKHTSRSILKFIAKTDKKIKCFFALIIIIGTMQWIFTGSHNHKSSKLKHTSEEISVPELAVTEDETDDNASIDEDESVETLENNDSEVIPLPANTNITSAIITKSVTVKKNDNLTSIFHQLKISKDDLNKSINNNKINSYLKKIKAGQKLDLTFNSDTHQLIELLYYVDKQSYFKITRDPKNPAELVGNVEKLNLSENITFLKIKIKSSLFEDAQKKHLPVDLVLQIIDIFTWDIDFAQDLRINDSVEVLYKEYFLDGQPHSHGPILAVNFNNNGKTYSAVRFENSNGANYYTPQGLSLRKAFIRTPVKFTRISSKFNLGRKHPLLHKIRAHRGVDYAAPTGTPIKAAGDGTIVHYGRKGGYGKAAIIQHGTKYTTLYAHMSQYNAKFKVGTTVKQGDVIGYVGQTGLASGPHLHFEFRVDGEHKNPLTVQLPKALPINNKDKNKFVEQSTKLASIMKKHVDYDNLNSNTLIAQNQRFE